VLREEAHLSMCDINGAAAINARAEFRSWSNGGRPIAV
jgi:hypothetical protein